MSAACASSRYLTRSSTRWAATSSHSRRESSSRSTAIPRRAGTWKRPASRCGSTRARNCHARATAARRASPGPSCAAERELDRLERRRGALDILDLEAGIEDHDRTPEPLREGDLGQGPPAAPNRDHCVRGGGDGEVPHVPETRRDRKSVV